MDKRYKIEEKVRQCLKCDRKFKSDVNRLCFACHAVNENIMSSNNYQVYLRKKK